MTNAKTAKEIRKAIPHWRMAIHETSTVPSTRNHYTTTIYARAGFSFSHDTPTFDTAWRECSPEKVLKDTAIQVRLQAGCPKQLYKRMKRYVSENSKHV